VTRCEIHPNKRSTCVFCRDVLDLPDVPCHPKRQDEAAAVLAVVVVVSLAPSWFYAMCLPQSLWSLLSCRVIFCHFAVHFSHVVSPRGHLAILNVQTLQNLRI
jgi:hypothetical protein